MFVLTDQQADEMLSRLTSYCKEYSLSVTDTELRKCIQHLDLVLETNKTTNLTRILNVEDAAVLHILDSLVLLPYINKAPEGALLDMGTGAGLPGIPLTIASGRKATYIDSVGKKVDAVNSFVKELGLKHAHAVHDRLEEYARSHKKQFSVVTARALAPLPILVEYAAPYLKDGGLFVITKGNPSNDELASGMSAAKICGFTLLLNDAIELPEGLGHREFIVLKKSHTASVSLPRANGMAKNPKIHCGTAEYRLFLEALHFVNETLAKKMAGDGEGATALFEVKIVGAKSKKQAKVLAKSVVCSNLTKTAIAGHDANWGRILCAMGYSGENFEQDKVDLFFESAAGKIQLIKDGVGLDFDEEKATMILSEPEVTAIADLKEGNEQATAWGCDLTHGYIDINADYRS